MTTAAVRYLSIEEFFREYGDREDASRWELVAGVPVMSPTESPKNRATAGYLNGLLFARLGTTYHYEHQSDVFLPPTRGRDTVRVPDLLVRRRTPGQDTAHGDLASVLLVVEILSPSTARTDRIAKRHEYAAAGIPAYLIVDVRGQTPTLTLYDVLREDPATEGGTATTTYADPCGDGTSVTLHLDGHDITLTAAELADAL